MADITWPFAELSVRGSGDREESIRSSWPWYLSKNDQVPDLHVAPEGDVFAVVAAFTSARTSLYQCIRTSNIACSLQAKFDNLSDVAGKARLIRRSGCPVSIALERFGDRWSLLIVRDLMVRGLRTFKDFQQSGEGIATNILADRLRKLEAAGIVTAEVVETDGRRVNYRLTEKGIDLAPVLLELLIWGARHERTGAPCALIEQMEKNRGQILVEARRRWLARDSTPLLPKFAESEKERKRKR